MDESNAVRGTSPATWFHRVRWKLRRRFWNALTIFKYHREIPTVIGAPSSPDARVDLVPFRVKYPSIPLARPVLARKIPRDEVDTKKQVFTRVQHALVRVISPMQREVPSINTNPEVALNDAYTLAHKRCFPPPIRPVENGLEALAVASPYASYLQSTGPGTFSWDLGALADFECHPGLTTLGAVVDFELDEQTGGLRAVRIETGLGTAQVGSAGWLAGERLAVCSITTHASMVRHFNWLHLTAGQPLEAATRNRLPAHHPLRRLLWPHVFGTHAGNELVTAILLSENGEFDSIFSLTHRGCCDLFDATAEEFDLASINPLLDADQRGVSDASLATPAQDHWSALYNVILNHARRYLALYYGSDDDVVNDQALGEWIDDLERLLPNGVRPVLGPTATMAGVASLLATAIYLAVVEHEITGSGLWDYQLWSDTSPVRIYEDGRAVPVDVYQRLVNANLTLNVNRTMLLNDAFPGLALDSRGASAFLEFQQDMLGLQARLDRGTPAPWRIEPRHLKANINA
jgi:arachidonate 15-lipoxygenase